MSTLRWVAALMLGAAGCVTGGNGAWNGQDAAPPQDDAEVDVELDAEPPEAEPDGGPPPAATCDDGARTGATGKTDGLKAGSLIFNVRVPASYVPTVGAPFIAVFAPAGADQNTTESFTGLTSGANGRGYIIAYANHISPSTPSTGDLAFGMVKKVIETWCIDERRIYLTGHSDGSSLITARMVARMEAPPIPAAIAPSAGGWGPTTSDACSKWGPIASMVMHSKNDALFPGDGRKFADYMIRCNECDPTPLDKLPNGCIPYGGCKDGADVQYCEGTAVHGVWPRLNTSILDFFDAHTR